MVHMKFNIVCNQFSHIGVCTWMHCQLESHAKLHYSSSPWTPPCRGEEPLIVYYHIKNIEKKTRNILILILQMVESHRFRIHDSKQSSRGRGSDFLNLSKSVLSQKEICGRYAMHFNGKLAFSAQAVRTECTATFTSVENGNLAMATRSRYCCLNRPVNTRERLGRRKRYAKLYSSNLSPSRLTRKSGSKGSSGSVRYWYNACK